MAQHVGGQGLKNCLVRKTMIIKEYSLFKLLKLEILKEYKNPSQPDSWSGENGKMRSTYLIVK